MPDKYFWGAGLRRIEPDGEDVPVAPVVELNRLADQIARYERLMDENLHIEKLLYEDGKLELSGTHPLGKAVISSLVSIFVSSGAENFFELAVYHPEVGPLAVTLQRVNGKTPGQIAGELREELDRLKSRPVSTVVFDGVAAAWNARHQVGDRIDYIQDNGEKVRTTLESPCKMAGGSLRAKVAGVIPWCDISRLVTL